VDWPWFEPIGSRKNAGSIFDRAQREAQGSAESIQPSLPTRKPAKAGFSQAGTVEIPPAFPVWIGATLALGITSALGVVFGRKLLRRIPPHRLHEISGVFFRLLAA